MVPRSFLETSVYGLGGEYLSNIVDVQVYRLRKKFAEFGITARILTLRRSATSSKSRNDRSEQRTL
jgi:DNA-binding response OmpR family regulator